MTCPNCHSEHVIGPEYTYHATLRVGAKMTCTTCRTTFDAYRAWGSGKLVTFFGQPLGMVA